ncbi:MAG TPA: hypothetical protein VFM57_09485 [Thermoleophilaceae bacterium]|nr:hypothetical protein [Thermoleophilaceae bacterium]
MTAVLRELARRPQQGRLADPGRALDDHQPALAPCALLGRLAKRGELRFPLDQQGKSGRAHRRRF